MSHDIHFITDFIRQLFWTPQLTLVLRVDYCCSPMVHFDVTKVSLESWIEHQMLSVLHTGYKEMQVEWNHFCQQLFISISVYEVNVLCIAAFEKKCMSMRNGVVYYGLP